jgi:hypothetical protein
MTDGEGPRRPSTGNVIAGVFLILLAIILILTGGGCTIAFFAFGGVSEAGMVPLLLISLAVLGGGATAMWFGVRLVSGRYD